MNTKKTLILTFFTIILILSIVILTQKTEAKEAQNPKNIHAFTKAICNESNFCQDHLIECENTNIKSISPITGATVQFDKEWQDPRTPKEIKKTC